MAMLMVIQRNYVNVFDFRRNIYELYLSKRCRKFVVIYRITFLSRCTS